VVRETVLGEIVTEAGGTSVTVAAADTAGVATLVALTVTVCEVVTDAGAV
jgi:hypothetical protein